VVGPAETLEAINDLLASASIFTSVSSELLAAELEDIAGPRLTFTQLKLLRLVGRQRRLTIGDIAAFLGISNAAASKAVDRLVRGGLLRRAGVEGDRRATEVTVTPEARALLDDFDARAGKALLKVLSGAGIRRLRDLSGGLDRLSVALSEGSEDPDSVCFRCGLYFRDECLLRDMSDRRCYLHLGETRRGVEGPARPRRGSADRAAVITGGTN
jgi:DNA-binding MarR family transcriptional regulator